MGVYLAKKVAVPMDDSEGPMNINSVATHAATEQRNNAWRSRALKWSSHGGSRIDASLGLNIGILCPCEC